MCVCISDALLNHDDGGLRLRETQATVTLELAPVSATKAGLTPQALAIAAPPGRATTSAQIEPTSSTLRTSGDWSQTHLTKGPTARLWAITLLQPPRTLLPTTPQA